MLFALVCAVFSAVCHGVAAAMQAVAARNAKDEHRGVDPRLLFRLFAQSLFVFSVGLNVIGLVAQIIALRALPLFVVQAAQAASIAVTAPIAVRWLRMRLSSGEWAGVAAVCVGLSLLGAAARGEGSRQGSGAFHGWLLASVLVILVLGLAAGLLPTRSRTAVLGLLSGLLFGALGLAIRVVPNLAPMTLLTSTATYTAIIAGVVASWFYASAMQRGSAVTATALSLVGETIPPSVIGIAVLGDSARPGWTPIAAFAFVVAVAGALVLARFGGVENGQLDQPELTERPAMAGV